MFKKPLFMLFIGLLVGGLFLSGTIQKLWASVMSMLGKKSYKTVFSGGNQFTGAGAQGMNNAADVTPPSN